MSSHSKTFSDLYEALREKEGRVYSDEELKNLPEISKQHPHFREWQMRKKSALALCLFLKEKEAPLNILEIGCGNGWLSHLLSQLPNSKVLGCDPGTTEILQANRVFSSVPNLKFQCLAFSADAFSEFKFDTIVFAASIQYFESFSNVVDTALKLLKSGGEIHIIDTPFYTDSDVKRSEENSERHFKQLGFPAMKTFYFRHTLKELRLFNHKFLYHPRKLLLQLHLQNRPFPWVCISKP
ncbi:MAG: class I SAM-dependent methyltransferase [Bacteroidia bacterium]|jgi:SAM-dependent methyltransferase|nr:class I SAM-dependent methyltransferase [Bacteroidia bacterium]